MGVDRVVESVRAGARLVLVVDDDAMVRNVLVSLLKRGGHATLDVGSGEEAVALVRARASELACLIVDYSMPGMRGDEVLRRVRDIAPGVPVVLASGYSEHPGADGQSTGQADYLLHKPFDGPTLLELVDSILAARASS